MSDVDDAITNGIRKAKELLASQEGQELIQKMQYIAKCLNVDLSDQANVPKTCINFTYDILISVESHATTKQ